MKKRKLLLLLVLLNMFCTNAQNAQDIIDGLKNDLKTNPDAKKTATIYSDLTWYYSNVSIDSALYYGGKAIYESKKLNDSTLMAQVFSDVGAVYFRKGDYQNSKEHYLIAYKIRKAKNDKNGMAKININLANIYVTKQQYKPAMKAYLKALDYFESSNNGPVVSTTKANIGYVFRELKNYPKAIKYLTEANDYERKNNLFDRLCTSCLNIGNVYLEMKDTIKALEFYKKSLKSCLKSGDKTAISSVYNNIGTIKSAQNKAKDAMALFNKSGKVRDELNSDLDKASLQLNIARDYTKAKRYEEARALLLKIKKIFENKKSNDNLLLTYNQLIPVYAHLNQPDSTTFYAEKYAFLKDQLLNTSVLNQTAELETKYQTEKKEKLLLQKDIEAKQKNNLLIVISVLTFFIVLIAFLIYRQQKLKATQQKQEFELKTAISKIETQNKLQEQRLAISRDLHDNIGSQLTFIISSVDNVKYAFDIQNDKLDTKLTNISSFAKDTIVELRDTIWAMNNEAITFEDLQMRILNFIEKAQNSQDRIEFKIDIDNDLNQYQWSSVAGMNIYRTIQEAINNAIKYSNATIISVFVKNFDNQIQITILDNGKGFDMETVTYGNGILNMQKRIEDINGTIAIASKLNEGTTIVLDINKVTKTT